MKTLLLYLEAETGNVLSRMHGTVGLGIISELVAVGPGQVLGGSKVIEDKNTIHVSTS